MREILINHKSNGKAVTRIYWKNYSPTLQSQSQSYDMTEGQSWNKAAIWGLRPHLYCCQTVADLLMRERSL
jgi:hypothetical protein